MRKIFGLVLAVMVAMACVGCRQNVYKPHEVVYDVSTIAGVSSIQVAIIENDDDIKSVDFYYTIDDVSSKIALNGCYIFTMKYGRHGTMRVYINNVPDTIIVY